MISEQARLALGRVVKIYTIDDVKNYSDNISEEYHNNKTWLNFYSFIAQKNMQVLPLSQDIRVIFPLQKLR